MEAQVPEQQSKDKVTCPICTEENPIEYKFCMKCGAPIQSSLLDKYTTDSTKNTIAATGKTLNKSLISNKTLLLIGVPVILLVIIVIGIRFFSSGNDPKKMIIGKWQASLGQLAGWGNVTETLEFFDNGTVTSAREIATFIGNYEWIDENTIRIDWQEQGIFGNSNSEVFRVKIENEKLTLEDTMSGLVKEYIDPIAVQATAEAAVDNIANTMSGTWEYYARNAIDVAPKITLTLNPDGTLLLTSNISSAQSTARIVFEEYEGKQTTVFTVEILTGEGEWPFRKDPLTKFRLAQVEKDKMIIILLNFPRAAPLEMLRVEN